MGLLLFSFELNLWEVKYTDFFKSCSSLQAALQTEVILTY